MEEIKEKDRFGNKYADTRMSDGRIKRCTQTNRNKEFEFMGNTYSWSYLRSLASIKNYEDEYHHQIELCRDKYGLLLLYFYDEYMNFSSDNDREDYLWVVVEDEADADELAEAYRLERLREPYIAADENGWMAAHQFVDEVKCQYTTYDIGAATTDLERSTSTPNPQKSDINDSQDSRIIIVETPGLSED